jgi:hypothetical protein
MHRFLSIAAVVFASLLYTSIAVLVDQGVADSSSQPPGLFIEGDLVSGVLGPSLCVLQNRFSPGDRVVFRARVFDAQTGQVATTATVTVRFADGSTLPLFYSLPRPPPHLDYGAVGNDVWVNVWVVPPDAPLGIVRYTIEAVDESRGGRYLPLDVEASLLTIVPQEPVPLLLPPPAPPTPNPTD